MGDEYEAMRQEGQETAQVEEAATYKAQAMRLMRDMTALLADRTVPSTLRKEVEDVRQALRKTWKDLGDEADGEEKPEEPEESEEPEKEEEGEESPEFRRRFKQAMGMMEAFGFEPVELSEPYPAEHAARLQPPSRYEQVRRQNDKLGPGIDVIWGITKEGKTEMQALRFDKGKFTAEEARKWLEDHDMAAIEFEAASEAEASEAGDITSSLKDGKATTRVKNPEFESKHNRGDDGQFAKKDEGEKGKGYVAPEGKGIDLGANKSTTGALTPEGAQTLLDAIISGKEPASVEKFATILTALGFPKAKEKAPPVKAKTTAEAKKATTTRAKRTAAAKRVARKVPEVKAKRKLSDEEYMVLTGQYPPGKEPPKETQDFVSKLVTPDVVSVLTAVAKEGRKISTQTDAAQIDRDARTPTGQFIAAHVTKTWGGKEPAPGAKTLLAAATKESVAEADKTVDGEAYPPSDFLVVEDEDAPSTFHLQVKRHGKPDHGLMGAARAALGPGFRGNKYEGPDKAKALAALKKLYEEEDMIFEAQATMADKVGGLKKLIKGKNKLALGMLKSLIKDAEGDDADTLQAVYDAIEGDDWAEASDLLGDVAETQPIIVNVFQETKGDDFDWAAFETRIKAVISDAYAQAGYEGEDDGQAQAKPAASEVEQAEAAVAEALGESAEGVEVLSEGAAPGNGEGPLVLRVKLLEPGFGNKRDGHYYPAEMLKRYAPVFNGAMMYETDHRPEEKSTRTWVSTVRKIVDYSPTGAPIAEVVVHHPGFAERVRNLAKAKDADGEPILKKLACSILANGQVRAGEVEGQKARIVEAITDAQAVDWVTRAGAGGQALAIMSEAQTEPDSNKGGAVMEEEQKPAQTEEPVQEKLATDCVASILKEAALPDPATQRLGEREYATEEQLREAIAAEVAYIKEVTGSGQVRDMGGTAKPEPKKPSERLAEKQAALDLIDQRYGLQR